MVTPRDTCAADAVWALSGTFLNICQQELLPALLSGMRCTCRGYSRIYRLHVQLCNTSARTLYTGKNDSRAEVEIIHVSGTFSEEMPKTRIIPTTAIETFKPVTLECQSLWKL